jgi:hypothetical protein
MHTDQHGYTRMGHPNDSLAMVDRERCGFDHYRCSSVLFRGLKHSASAPTDARLRSGLMNATTKRAQRTRHVVGEARAQLIPGIHHVAKTWRSLRLGGKGIQRLQRNLGPIALFVPRRTQGIAGSPSCILLPWHYSTCQTEGQALLQRVRCCSRRVTA